MESQFHGVKTIKGEGKFTVPRENFMIEPLPAGGTYALYYNKLKETEVPVKIANIKASQPTKVKGLTPGVEVYVSGVGNSVEFNIRW